MAKASTPIKCVQSAINSIEIDFKKNHTQKNKRDLQKNHHQCCKVDLMAKFITDDNYLAALKEKQTKYESKQKNRKEKSI